ncbi:MAG: ABC transporter substrate-binding protein [Dehalococcoidales bacterium]|nr:ABC transporter substrate-binding protein [Dehalococcoidales bacterium]
MRKLFVILALILLPALLLSACGNPAATTPAATPTQESKYGGTLRYIWPFELTQIPGWPTDSTNPQRMIAGFTIFEPLVKLDINGNPIPWLATGWEWGPNYSYITFTLRQGVKFHDGTTFTAEAVVAEAQELINLGRAGTQTWDRWEILDDYHVRLYLKEYKNDFWTGFAGIEMMFFSPTAYKEHGVDWMKEHPIGTGPFKFESFEKGVHLKLVKNEDYWQKGKPYLDGLTILFVKEKLTQLQALEAGEADMLAFVEGKDLADMKSKGFTVRTKMEGTDFIMFDTKNESSIFRDARVRKAIEHAIDKEAIVEAMGYGFLAVNNQMSPPQYASHNADLPSREYNPDKAKQLLAEAGYPNGFATKIITMGGYHSKALAVQEFLKAIGIQAEVELVDNAKFWDYMLNGWENAMVVTGYAVDVNFPAWLKAYFPPTSVIDVSVKLPDEVIAKIEPALSEADPAKAKQLSDEIIRLIWEDCSYIPISSNAMGFVESPKVHDSGTQNYYAFYIWDPDSVWLSK